MRLREAVDYFLEEIYRNGYFCLEREFILDDFAILLVHARDNVSVVQFTVLRGTVLARILLRNGVREIVVRNYEDLRVVVEVLDEA